MKRTFLNIILLIGFTIIIRAQTVQDLFNSASNTDNLFEKQQFLKKAFNKDSENPIISNSLGVVEARLGNIEAAEDYFTRSISLINESVIYHNRGYLKLSKQDLSGATRDFRSAIDLDPDFPAAYQMLANVAMEQGNYNKALFLLSKSLELEPTYAAAHYYTGIANYKLGKTSEAIENLHFVSTLMSRFKYPGADFVFVSDDFNSQYESKSKFEVLKEIPPGTSKFYSILAEMNAEIGRVKEAHKAYSSAIAAEPENIELLLNRGSNLIRAGRYNLAIRDFRYSRTLASQALTDKIQSEEIEIEGGETLTYYSLEQSEDQVEYEYLKTSQFLLGICYNRMGSYIDALNQFSLSFLDENENLAPELLNEKGFAKENLGRYNDAKEDYEQALLLNPDYLIAQNNLFRVQSIIDSDVVLDLPRTFLISVGVNNYEEESKLNPLRFSSQNAYAIAGIFERRGNANNEYAEVLIDNRAGKEHILNAIENKFNNQYRIRRTDMVVFYFSGHGTTINGITGICPYDYDNTISGLLSVDELLLAISRSPARRKVCIIESCKDSSILESPIEHDHLATLGPYSEKVIFMSSTKHGTQSVEDEEIGGVFSHFLKIGLEGGANKDRNKYISVRELFDYLKSNVSEYTDYNQIPEVNKSNLDLPIVILK